MAATITLPAVRKEIVSITPETLRQINARNDINDFMTKINFAVENATKSINEGNIGKVMKYVEEMRMAVIKAFAKLIKAENPDQELIKTIKQEINETISKIRILTNQKVSELMEELKFSDVEIG